MNPLCPFPTCRRSHPFFRHFFLNQHTYVHDLPFESLEREDHARWKHGNRPCCELCQAFKEYAPNFYFGVIKSPFWQGIVLEQIKQAYRDLHDYYRENEMGLLPLNDYDVSFGIEQLSQELWHLFKMDPFFFPELRGLAEQLRDMGTEQQIGPPRELYYTMPRVKFPRPPF